MKQKDPSTDDSPASAPGTPVDVTSEATRSARRRSGIRAGAVVLALLLGIGIGVLLSSWVSRDDAALLEETEADLAELRTATARLEERNWKLFREGELAREELAQATGESTATADAPAAEATEDEPGVFADGVYLVPEDMPTGAYDGVVTGDFGYWARLKNTEGMVSSIEANGVVKGPFVLEVNPSDRAVELRGVVLTAR
jgi:hypothetical protein